MAVVLSKRLPPAVCRRSAAGMAVLKVLPPVTHPRHPGSARSSSSLVPARRPQPERSRPCRLLMMMAFLEKFSSEKSQVALRKKKSLGSDSTSVGASR